MALGKRKRRQEAMWIGSSELPKSPGHPFYQRLNVVLDEAGFDLFAEKSCERFYAGQVGRPSLLPGRYFRLLLLGYFEGLESERGIAWRAADSLAVRSFLNLGLDERGPDHSTISRTRRLIDVETHREVFSWVLERLAQAGLVKGTTLLVDGTTLEANAAMRSIVRRDTGEPYEEYLKGLAKASGIRTPTRAVLARLDRRRKKKGSNEEWKSPSDPDAKITKMKDGTTHLAYKAEHVVDLDSDLILIEANYDEEMLNRSPRLDRGRVGSNVGHFSNAQAGKFLVRVLQESRKSPQAVVLCHLSADHNSPELARRTVREILCGHRFGDVPVHAARREGSTRRFTV